MWASVGRLADQLMDAAKPGQIRRAQALGKDDAETLAAGGEVARPLLGFGDIYEARRAAAEEAYVAGRANDFDVEESALRAQHAANLPDYENAVSELRTRFVQDAAPDYAVKVEDYANRRIGAGRAAVADQAGRIAVQEANVEIGARQGVLTARLVRMIRDGEDKTVEYELLNDERNSVIRSRLDNPAIAYSESEAAADDREFVVAAKAAVFTRYAVAALREEGPDAAIASLQEILKDPDLEADERQGAFEQARAAVNQEIALATDRANIAQAARTRAESEMNRRIEDDAASVEIGGDGTGLTEGEVMAALGPSGVADWYRKRAEALERNRETGDLAGLSPEEAARRIADSKEVASASQDFKGLVDWVIENSEGSALVRNDNGAGRARYGITERSHPEAWRDGDVSRQEAEAIYKRDYWDAIGADALSPGLRIVAFDAAINHGPGKARQWIEESGGDPARFISLRREHYQALARGDPTKYGDDLRGWLNRLDSVTTRVNAMGAGDLMASRISNARQGFTSDPIAFASQHRMAALPELNVDDAFRTGQVAQNWQASLRQRLALGGQLADQHGVPLRILTNGEAAAYRDRIERDPAAAVTLARLATAALGGRGARDLLAEVGQNSGASTAIHIADLGAAGGDVRFADAAAQGIALKQQGQTLDTERKNEIDAEMRRWRSAVAGSPSLLAAVANTAQAAALADSVSGFDRPADYYVQAALGRTTWGRNRYGGAAEVNSATVVVPRWLNGEYFDDALALLPERPIYDNGQPMPAASVSRLRPALQPNGNYRLLDQRGRVAYGRNRQPFEVDLDQYRDLIRSRLGTGAVRPD